MSGDESRQPAGGGSGRHDLEVEHLKMIVGVVDRLAHNSFLIKGWTISLVAALSVLSRSGSEATFTWVAVCMAPLFGLLDAWYLTLERRFRGLFRRAVDGEVAPFDMTPDKVRGDFGRAFLSLSILPLYGTVFIGALVLATISS